MKKLLSFCFSAGLSIATVQAQDPYFLDPYFGNTGVVVAPNALFGNGPYVMNKVKNMGITSDNKIVLAGNIGMFYSMQGVSTDHAITRLKSNGQIDPSFNNTGHIVFNATNQPDVKFMDNMTILPDDKILYAGSSSTSAGSKTVIYKINTDGSFDHQFGTNGVARISGPNTFNSLYTMDVQSGGKILLFTSSFSNGGIPQAIITRLNANGSLDNTFGSNGHLIPDLGFASNFVTLHMAKVLGNDGFLVVGTFAGNNNSYSDHQYFLAKFNPDGTLNTSFGTNGKLIIPRSSTEHFTFYNKHIDVDNSGHIYINFSKSSFPIVDPAAENVLIIKVSPGGVIDANYGIGGRVTFTDLYHDHHYYYDAQIQDNNKLLVAAMMDTGTAAHYMLKRLNADGSEDLTFTGTTNELTGTRQAFDHFHLIGMQYNDKIVLGGYGKREKNAADTVYPVVMRFTNTREEPPVDTGTSIVPIGDQSKIRVFPNPAVSYINIEGFKHSAQAILYDMSGRVVLRSQLNEQETRIDCSRLTPAIYWLHLKEEHSNITYTHKLVKQ